MKQQQRKDEEPTAEKPDEKPGVKEQRDAARQQPESPGEPATGE
jgi:hypothetical protein